MYCYKCGRRLLQDALFCHKCGTNVPEEVRSRADDSPEHAEDLAQPAITSLAEEALNNEQTTSQEGDLAAEWPAHRRPVGISDSQEAAMARLSARERADPSPVHNTNFDFVIMLLITAVVLGVLAVGLGWVPR